MESTIWQEPLKRHSVFYVRQGWWVVPLWSSTTEGCGCGDPLCSKPGMHPMQSIVSSARNSEDEVLSMISGYPPPNVGIVTGTSSGIVALALDCSNEKAARSFDLLQSVFGLQEATAEITSQRTRTLIYRLPQHYSHLPLLLTANEFPGIEILGEANYIVAPPSEDQIYGEKFRWKMVEPVVEIPITLLEHFIAKRLSMKFSCPKKSLVGEEISDNEVSSYLFRFYTHLCSCGFTTAEARQVTIDQTGLFNMSWTQVDMNQLLRDAEAYLPPSSDNSQGFPWTDMQWASAMISFTYGDVFYIPEEGIYRKNKNGYWQAKEIVEIESELYQKVFSHSYGILSHETDLDRMKTMHGKLSYYQRADTIKKVKELFRNDPRIIRSISRFDQLQSLLPCRNGTINLTTGKIYPSFRDDLVTKKAGTYINRDANCPQWKRFIDFVTGGDPAIAMFIQKVVGYLLCGSNPLEKMFILYGPEGTGKTTFIYVLQSLFGSLARRTNVSTFVDTSSVRNGLAALKDTRLVIADENDGEDSGYLSTPLLKQVVSGEKVEARFLYKEFFEFEVTFKIIIATNYRPAFKIFDDALKRRIVVIPFMNKVTPDQYDSTLKGSLERELPGILNWALEGLEFLKRYGLTLPFHLQKILHEYSLEFNSIKRFIADACVEDRSALVSSRDLYQLYCVYCKAYGEGRPMKHKNLSIRIEKSGYSKRRTKDGVYFIGIRQKDKYRLASEWNVSIDEVE